MITIKVENLHVHVHVPSLGEVEPLAEILTQLAGVRQDIKEFRDAMKLTDQELTDLLNGIDKTTSHTADNVATIGTVAATIKTEVDAFVAAAPAGTTLSDAQVAQLQSIGTRAQAMSAAADAQVTVLQAIAAEGQPVTPPPPAPVTIPTPPQP